MTNLPTLDAIALDTVHGGSPAAPPAHRPPPPRARPVPNAASNVVTHAPPPVAPPPPPPMNQTDVRMHPRFSFFGMQFDLPIEIHTTRTDAAMGR